MHTGKLGYISISEANFDLLVEHTANMQCVYSENNNKLIIYGTV